MALTTRLRPEARNAWLSKPENAQRVFDAVELLDYRIDPLASDLRRARRRIIGAIVPEFESEFFGSVITQLETLAEQSGYALVAASSRESETHEKEILARMHDWCISGVVRRCATSTARRRRS